MSIPAFEQMRGRVAPVCQKYEEDILWAGIFGSVSRNRAHAKSDVDILIVFKGSRIREPIDLRDDLEQACGREISVLCIWQGPRWAWGHVRLEALLSSRTVFGERKDVEHLRQGAVTYLQDGLVTLGHIGEHVNKLKNLVSIVQTYENFIQPSQEPTRRECISELHKLVDLLDMPGHHPIRTMQTPWAFDFAKKIRLILNRDQPAAAAGEAPVWETIWNFIEPTSTAMWSFDAGCAAYGPNYIRHMFASKTLADTFELGGEVNDDMYKDILR